MKKKHDRIADELQLIAKKHPKHQLLPKDVVKFAENKKTALHSCFEWDSRKAAYQFRLEQARRIIRVYVEIIQSPDSNKEHKVRTFVSLSSDRKQGGGYRVTTSVLNDDDLQRQMLQDALEELEVFRRKYHHLKELCSLFAVADRLLSRRRKKAA